MGRQMKATFETPPKHHWSACPDCGGFLFSVVIRDDDGEVDSLVCREMSCQRIVRLDAVAPEATEVEANRTCVFTGQVASANRRVATGITDPRDNCQPPGINGVEP